jgi:GcrA cell cycle regulator
MTYFGKKLSPWTPQTDEQLLALWADGNSAAEVARHMGMGLSRSSIIGRLYRIGAPKRATETRHLSPRVIPMPKPKAPPVPPPEAPEPVLIDGKPVTLLTARACQCRWIADEIPRGDSPICGHDTTAPSEPFCAYHRNRAYNVQHRQSA